jgi:hypothetical protein
MIELQKMILAAIYSDDSFARVSFLRSEDFMNYENNPLKTCFELIIKAKGNLLSNALIKIENKHLLHYMIGLSSSGVINNLEYYALSLAETRIREVFKLLLIQLSSKTKNALESKIIDDCVIALETEDVFKLSEVILEFLGAQASNYSKKRISDFLKYRDKRIAEIKNCIDGY